MVDDAQILALRDEALAGFERHRSDFQSLERGLFSIIDEGKRTSLKKRRKSTLTPMLIRPKVDAMARDIMRAFFGTDELADIQPETGGDENDMRVAEALKEELKEFAREEKLYFKVKPAVKSILGYGTCATKVYFSQASNSVKIERCKLNEVYFDPKAPSPFDVKYIVHRIDSKTIAELKKMFPGKKVDWSRYVGNSRYGANNDPASNEIGEYQRLEIFDVYRLKNGKWFVSTVVDDTVIIKDKRLKFGHPFILSAAEEQFVMIDETPVRAYGDPFISPLIPLQSEYVIRRNQQVDAIDAQLNMRLLVMNETGLRDEDLNSTRKKIVVNDINQVRELPYPRIDQSLFDVQQLDVEAETISGVSKYSQGVSSDGNRSKTKGEAMILDARSSSVADDLTRAISESFFRPLISRIIMLTYYNKTSARFAGIDRTGPLRQKVIISVGTGSTNTEVKLQQIDAAIETTITIINAAAAIAPEVAEKHLSALEKLNSEKLKLLGQNQIVEEIESDYTSKPAG